MIENLGQETKGFLCPFFTQKIYHNFYYKLGEPNGKNVNNHFNMSNYQMRDSFTHKVYSLRCTISFNCGNYNSYFELNITLLLSKEANIFQMLLERKTETT